MSFPGSIGSFISDAANTIGKGAEMVGEGIVAAHVIPTKAGIKVVGKAADVAHDITDKIAKVPILGPIFGVYTGVHYFNAIYAIANGERIDKAAINSLKNQIKDYKAVAPYVASVIAFVPGVGPGVGAAISAGAALAEGQPLSEVSIAAARGAVPGGAIAQAAFSIAVAVAQGKPIEQVAIAALPISESQKKLVAAGATIVRDVAEGKKVTPEQIAIQALPISDQQKRALSVAAAVTRDVAEGKSVDKALLAQADEGMKILSPELGKAFNVGGAMGIASGMQDKIAKQITTPQAMTIIASVGKDMASGNDVVTAARNLNTSPQYQAGFDLAMGIMHAKKGNQNMITALRNQLTTDEERKGFDSAAALRIGVINIDELKDPALTTKTNPAKAALRGALGIQPYVLTGRRVLGKANPKITSADAKIAITAIQNRQISAAAKIDPAVQAARQAEIARRKTAFLAVNPKVSTPISRPQASATEHAAFYITTGLQDGAVYQKQGIVAELAKNPESRQGAKDAILAIAESRKDESLWDMIKRVLFGIK